jgi:hypothetical protein
MDKYNMSLGIHQIFLGNFCNNKVVCLNLTIYGLADLLQMKINYA